nr:acyl-CoA carboxylase epsilon subunit [Amycolatopsis arida]
MSAVDPEFRVNRGRPDDVEVAALAVVIAAAAAAPPPAPVRRRSRWADPAPVLGVPPRAAPGAWRASGGPA